MQNTQHRDRNLLSVSFSLTPHTTYFYTQGPEQWRELKTKGIQSFYPNSLRNYLLNHQPLPLTLPSFLPPHTCISPSSPGQ